MTKISSKYFTTIMASIMTVFMGLAMSFVVTLVNIGWTTSFFLHWAQAFAFAFPIALPLSIIITPVVFKLTAMIVDKP